MNKNRFGTLAAIALLTIIALCATTMPVAAETRVYASGVTVVDWFHIGLIYNVPLSASDSAYIGGVNQATLDRYAPEHSNVQQWDRRSYNSGKSVLLIPKRYVWHRWNFASEIYLAFPSGRV